MPATIPAALSPSDQRLPLPAKTTIGSSFRTSIAAGVFHHPEVDPGYLQNSKALFAKMMI
jgi:hypothetical protein